MNYQKYTRFYNNLYFQIIIKIFYFLLIFIDNLYAKNKVPISYGGELNTTFGRLAGVRAGGGRISGYGWLSSYHKIDEKHYITGNAGISLEGKTSNKLILNDLSIGLHDNKSQFFLGRTLSAAGKLHHDIIDFGAPGGGSDNTPVSYFYNGNYTTNVAQKLTLPFSERIAYYIKPYKDYFAIGISYAPNIGTYHPENYQFFAQTPVKDEISFAINNEIQISNFYIGITGGYTQAYRPFNRLNSQGLIKSTQYSFFVKQALNQRSFYNLYELNHGCLEDKAVDDCRIGFQISKMKNRYIRNLGIQHRYHTNSLNSNFNTDYFMGWSYSLQDNLKVGFETILRREEKSRNISDKTINTDFNWLAGVQYRF